MTELSFRHVDKSIGQFLRLMQVTPLDKVIEEWKNPATPVVYLETVAQSAPTPREVQENLYSTGRYYTSTGTGRRQGDASGITGVWVPMVQDHCERTKLLDPLNKG